MSRNLFLFFLISLTVALFGCKNFNDIEEAEIISGNAEFAIPLLTATTSLQELLEQFDDRTTIEISPDGLIKLRYFGDVTNRTSKEIIEASLGSLPELIPLPDTLFELPFSSPNELEVDFATFNQGELRFGFFSPSKEVKELTIHFLQAEKDGAMLTINQVFPVPTNLFPQTVATPVDLTGYNLVPEDGKLYVWYDARDEIGNRVIFDPDNGDILVLELKNLDFSYIEGYLGNHIHKGGRDTIAIEFFENWIQGDVYFEDPKVWVHVENSFGLPTQSLIQIFKVYTADGEERDLESEFLEAGKGIDFAFPDLANVGSVETMSFPFNKDNSNIEDILSSRPVALDYEVDALTNPDSLPDIRGFLTDSSFYKVQVEVELPIHGTASGFEAIDTFDMDFSGYKDVEWAEFKIVAENDIPLDIEMQIYFADQEGNILDSLLNSRQRIIEAAPVDGNGIVTDRVKTETFAPVETARFDKIRAATNIYLHAFFSTFNEGHTPVKVFNTQEVEIRMGMKLGLN